MELKPRIERTQVNYEYVKVYGMVSTCKRLCGDYLTREIRGKILEGAEQNKTKQGVNVVTGHKQGQEQECETIVGTRYHKCPRYRECMF